LVKEIKYSINDGAEQIYNSALTFNADSVSTLSYYSVDNANNPETSKQIIIKLDKTPPVIQNITVTPKSWDSCAAGGWFFWLIFFIDTGEIKEYPVVHGCVEVNADIDASISGLQEYTIKLYDPSNNLVASSTNEGINFNFVTDINSYKIVVEVKDNANNYGTTAMNIFEDDDEDYVPDNLDLCKTIKPAVDVNKDGCPDQPGIPGQAWEQCVNIYTGSAASSIYPTSVMNVFTNQTIIKGDKTWYGFNSAIANINAISYITMRLEENSVTQCSLDLKSVDSTTEKGKKKHIIIDKDVKIKEENKDNNYQLQETWKLDLDDGSKVRAEQHFNGNNDQTKIHITYENKAQEKVCSDVCDVSKTTCLSAVAVCKNNCGVTKTSCLNIANACSSQCTTAKNSCITSCGKDNNCKKTCESTATSCSNTCNAKTTACNTASDSCNKVCDDSNKACDATEKTCKDTCRDANNFNIKNDYTGLKTVSLYDIMKLVGYA